MYNPAPADMESKIIMKSHRTILLLAILAVLLVNETYANLVGNDDFSSNIENTNKWQPDITRGVGQLMQTNGHLEFTTTGTPTTSDISARGWILNDGSDTADWSVQLDVNITNAALNPGQAIYLGLSIAPKGGDGSTNMVLLLGDGNGGRYFASALNMNSPLIPSQTTNTTSTSAAIRIRWKSADQSLVSEIDPNGGNGVYHWESLTNWNIGNGPFNWNMSSSSEFVVIVFGEAQNLSVQPHDVFGANFIAPPSMEIHQNGGSVNLLWSTNATGYTVETAHTLSGASLWTMETNQPFIVGEQYVISNQISSSPLFYQLIR